MGHPGVARFRALLRGAEAPLFHVITSVLAPGKIKINVKGIGQSLP
jgi:hypothetical protein